jgi:hypothetical protein
MIMASLVHEIFPKITFFDRIYTCIIVKPPPTGEREARARAAGVDV